MPSGKSPRNKRTLVVAPLRQAIRLALLLGLAGSSWWLLRLATAPMLDALPPLARQADAYLTDFEVTVMNPAGRVYQILEGERMIHFVGSHISEVTQPHLTAYDEEGTPWHARSQTGLVNDETDHVTLMGNVQVDHVDLHGRLLQVRTEDLQLDTQRRSAVTDRLVEITHYGGATRGQGLRASLADGTLSLLAEVRGEYVPVAP